jgi:hypothetical protein
MAGDSIRRLRAGIVALALDAGRVDAVFVTPPFETIARPNAACRSQPQRLTHPHRPAVASVATSGPTAGASPRSAPARRLTHRHADFPPADQRPSQRRRNQPGPPRLSTPDPICRVPQPQTHQEQRVSREEHRSAETIALRSIELMEGGTREQLEQLRPTPIAQESHR